MNQTEFWDTIAKDLKPAKKQATCNICGNIGGTFIINKIPICLDWAESFSGDIDLRESLVCSNCGSTSRDRMLIWTLGKYLKEQKPLKDWKENKKNRVLESGGYRKHPQYLGEKFDYYNTFFEPEKTGKEINSNNFADFQNLPFEKEFFNIVLSSDVFEHIRLDLKAFREVFRVLKKGGKFFLQIPYCNAWEKTLVKVKPDEKKDVFLTEPEYHDENTLVYRIYGKDLLKNLEKIGFSSNIVIEQISTYMISKQPIIIGTKLN